MITEILLLILFLLLALKILRKQKNLPPGPKWSLPLIGNVIPVYPSDARKMAEKFGNIFMIKMGAIHFLFLSDFKLSKEAFSLPEFSQRPLWRVASSLKNGRLKGDFLGLINANGDLWQRNRRFTMKHLKDLGMGTSKLEKAILIEVENLIGHFSTLADGEPFHIPFALNVAILNVIFQLIASHRYDFDDEFVKTTMNRFNDFHTGFMLQAIQEFFPFVTYCMPRALLDKVLGFNKGIKLFEEFYNDIRPFIEDHKHSLIPNAPRDLIDEYLIAKEKKNTGISFEEYDLLKIIFDLFVAGNDTTSKMTKWVILYMARYPEIQERVQNAIDKVVSRDEFPALEHRNSLGLVDAVVNESLRMASFAPFGVFHSVVSNTNFKGYHIPKVGEEEFFLKFSRI